MTRAAWVAISILLAAPLAPGTPCLFAAPAVVAFTADTEGHAGPCTQCPGHAGLGGLARRATAIAGLRAAGPVLLLDAGNALYGADSISGNGGVIVDAYNRLAYDAVNLTPRDVRLGRQALADALKPATFDAVSANLLDAGSGRPLAKPYVVKTVAGRRLAVVGVSEPPAGMDYLPHLRRQLAGVTIVPPAEALTRWLPKAKEEADDVVLLYYGPAGGAKKIADAFGKDLAAILVGGARPEELPQGTAVPLAATAEHGKSLARLTLGAKEPAGQIAIDDSVAPDRKMASFLAEATRPAAPQAPAPGADAKAAADVGDATDGGVRKLVQVEVPPIEPAAAEPAPAPSTAAARAEPTPAEPARSEPPTPKDATADAAAEPADTSKPTAAPHAGHFAGAWDFLKSLVGGGAKPSKATSAEKAPPAESEKPGPADESASKRPAADEPAPATEASAPANPPAVQPQRAPAAAATGPKFCTNCGAKLSPNAKFCTHCGTRVRR